MLNKLFKSYFIFVFCIHLFLHNFNNFCEYAYLPTTPGSFSCVFIFPLKYTCYLFLNLNKIMSKNASASFWWLFVYLIFTRRFWLIMFIFSILKWIQRKLFGSDITLRMNRKHIFSFHIHPLVMCPISSTIIGPKQIIYWGLRARTVYVCNKWFWEFYK